MLTIVVGLLLSVSALAQSDSAPDENPVGQSQVTENESDKATPEQQEPVGDEEAEANLGGGDKDASGQTASEDASQHLSDDPDGAALPSDSATPGGGALDSSNSPEQSSSDFASKEAQALYELGLSLSSKQLWNEACAVFTRVEETSPGSDWARRATEQRSMIGQLPDTAMCGVSQPRRLASGFDLGQRSGDVELAVSQAVVGTSLGLMLPNLFMPDGAVPEVMAASTLVGLGGGLAGSIAASKSFAISEGQAMAVFTGEYMGAYNGLALSMIVYPFGPPGPLTPLRFATVGLVGGAGAGIAAAVNLDPSAGQMALVRSGATWGSALGLVSFLIVEPANMRSDWTRMLLGSDLGLAGGILIGRRTDVSRGRVNLVNLSGYAGAVVALGLLGTIGLYDVAPEVVGISLIAFSGAGLGLGTHLTRNMRTETDGGTAGVGAEYRDGKWYFGVPIPTVSPDRTGSVRVSVPLASGRF